MCSPYTINSRFIKIRMTSWMHIGIDMSLSSPGVAICIFKNKTRVKAKYQHLNSRFFLKKKRKRTSDNETVPPPPPVVVVEDESSKWAFMAFAQRKSDMSVCTDNRITIYPKYKNDIRFDIERYVYVNDSILEYINTQRKTNEVHIENIKIFIEGYAFKTIGTGSSYKLHELGGILRYSLFKFGILPSSISTLYSTQWKACNVGVSASKFDTLCHVKSIEDIASIFSNTSCSEKKVPNPLQDVADAIGITLASLCLSEPEEKSTELSHKK